MSKEDVKEQVIICLHFKTIRDNINKQWSFELYMSHGLNSRCEIMSLLFSILLFSLFRVVGLIAAGVCCLYAGFF